MKNIFYTFGVLAIIGVSALLSTSSVFAAPPFPNDLPTIDTETQDVAPVPTLYNDISQELPDTTEYIEVTTIPEPAETTLINQENRAIPPMLIAELDEMLPKCSFFGRIMNWFRTSENKTCS